MTAFISRVQEMVVKLAVLGDSSGMIIFPRCFAYETHATYET
jgi:hypothetical protein